jgi:hypothetical protein
MGMHNSRNSQNPPSEVFPACSAVACSALIVVSL